MLMNMMNAGFRGVLEHKHKNSTAIYPDTLG